MLREFVCHFIRQMINTTLSCEDDEQQEKFGTESIVVPILFGIIFVVGFLGNLVVILIIVRNHKRKDAVFYRTGIFAKNLAT